MEMDSKFRFSGRRWYRRELGRQRRIEMMTREGHALVISNVDVVAGKRWDEPSDTVARRPGSDEWVSFDTAWEGIHWLVAEDDEGE